MKKFSIILSVILIFSQNAFAFLDNDEKLLAGIRITSANSNFYLEYQQDDSYDFESYKKQGNQDLKKIRLNFNNDLLNTKALNYSGYRNVEGFKNNKKKQDRQFTTVVVAVIAGIVVAGGLVISAVVDAVDD